MLDLNRIAYPKKLQDVARSVGVCDRTVRAWIAEGLPHFKPSPRVTLIYPHDLEEWLASKRMVRETQAQMVGKMVDDIMRALP